MTTIKVKFRSSSLQERKGVLYYQLIHGRTIRQIKTEYRIHSDEWNGSTSELKLPASDEKRTKSLEIIRLRIRWDLKRLYSIIDDFNQHSRIYTADEVVSRFANYQKENSLFLFMEGIITQLNQLNRPRTSETYTSTLNSFARFRQRSDVMLDEIDSDLMLEYEAYLKSERVCPNTVSFYMRILRAVYNRAVEKKMVKPCNPFKHVYTGVDKTVKRAISLDTIKRIKNLDLSLQPSLDYARNLFLFSFYTRGMSFVDMAYLKKKDVSNGILSYRRKKTGQQLYVKWEKCMQEIIDQYPSHSTLYFLPIIRDANKSERTQYQNASALINRKLKEIQRLLKLETPLTMYVTRHSWASIAKSKNIPLAVISESMGHDSEATTKIYLASLATNVIDKANSLILKDI